MTKKIFGVWSTVVLAILAVVFLPQSVRAEESDPPPIFDTDGHDDAIDTLLQQGKRQYNSGVQTSSDSPNDDSIRLSNSAVASPEAVTSMEDWNCDGKGHIAVESDGSTTPYSCRPLLSKSGDAGRTPTTREILYYAATTIHADGAGLHKRPDGVSYTNKHIPTLVAATHPTQTHVINLLGHDITITLTATSYTWNWGDGTPDLTTTSPGVPWHKGMKPNTDPALIRHYYTPPNGWRSRFDGPYPTTTRTITLTTTWAGTATNPFTGETQTINGLVTTTETTGPFRLSHLLISNTDTWEESQGH